MSDPTGIVHDMPEAEYHARPELSSTQARALLDSPARYHYALTHREEKTAYDFGHAAHAKILGVGSPVIEYPDEHLTPSGNISTKAETKAWASEQRAAGLVPVAPGEVKAVDIVAEAVLAHPEARRLLELDGHSEVSAFSTDPETGVRVRARIDRLSDEYAVDLKTVRGSAGPVEFGREAAKFGYPVQQAWYLDALKLAGAGGREFRFIVVEKSPPHLVAVHMLDDVTMAAAHQMAKRAREIYAECIESGRWPGYGDETLVPYVPAWFSAEFDEVELTL